MRRGHDMELARSLADALDGVARPTGELEALVRVLEAAAAEARFAVAQDATEHALAAARPGRRQRSRRALPLAVAAAAAAVIAAALLLFSPFGSTAPKDVQARALAALGGPSAVLQVVEHIRPGPGGGFAASIRSGWIDPARGRALWAQTASDGTVVDQTLVERGRITRYDPATRSAVVAGSCRALATGCASAIDPVTVYRRALVRASAALARPVTFHGHAAYRFSLPVQRLADAVAISQVVTVDARTLLPERIEWREQRPGRPVRTAAVIDIVSVTSVRRPLAPADAFALTVPRGTSVTQLAAPGRPVRLLGTRRISVAEARRLVPAVEWLGRRSGGLRLRAITLVRYDVGIAVRLSYGPLVVWNYGPVIPPQLLANRLVPLKQVPIGGRTGRIYSTVGGRLAVEVDRPGGTVALVGPTFSKTAFFGALPQLRPMR